MQLQSENRRRQALTILCPCYNEEGVVSAFFDQLKPVIDQISDKYQANVVFLNNASEDGTLDEILALRAKHPNISVITFSRNVGYQCSLDSGLRSVDGDLFMFIDVDCEDPPSLIPEFLKKYEEGYDIVYGERVDRDEPKAIKRSRAYFYRILQRLADDDIILDMAEFGLFTAEVREAVISDENTFPFVRSSISRVGYKRFGIPFKRQQRIGGQTHYNILGMVIFAVAGILSASTLFLRLPTYILPFWLIAITALTATHLIYDAHWAFVTMVYLAFAYIGSALAMACLYTGRNYKNGLKRPTAFIRKRDTYLEPEVVVPDEHL